MKASWGYENTKLELGRQHNVLKNGTSPYDMQQVHIDQDAAVNSLLDGNASCYTNHCLGKLLSRTDRR